MSRPRIPAGGTKLILWTASMAAAITVCLWDRIDRALHPAEDEA